MRCPAELLGRAADDVHAELRNLFFDVGSRERLSGLLVELVHGIRRRAGRLGQRAANALTGSTCYDEYVSFR